MREFGYWREQGPKYGQFPSINEFLGNSEASRLVVEQLRSAPVIAATSGLSFPCVLCGATIATTVHVRGVGDWEWLDTLPHYVETHDVRLPDELVRLLQQLQQPASIAAAPTQDK